MGRRGCSGAGIVAARVYRDDASSGARVGTPRVPCEGDRSLFTASRRSVAFGADDDDYSKGLNKAEAHLYSDALPLLTKALEEDPDDERAGTAMYYVAICHQEMDDKDNAIAAYKAFIKKFPKHDKVRSAKNNLAKKYAETVD